MCKPIRQFSVRGNVLFFLMLGFIVIGFAVAFAGGMCMDAYGEETEWAVALFLVGILVVILSCTGLVLVGYIERNRGIRDDERHAALISPDTYYAGGTFVTFTAEGVRIVHGDGEPFEEGKTLVPYKDVLIYRAIERRSPKSKGKRLTVLEVPVRYFGIEESEEGEEDFARCALNESERLDGTLQKFAPPVKDYACVPAKESKRLPLKRFRGGRNRIAEKVFYPFLAVLFLGLLALAALCWAGLFEGGAMGGFAVLGADVWLSAILWTTFYFGTRNYCTLYDRGFRLINGYKNSAFFVWEQVQKITKFEAGKETYLMFDLGYMGIIFLDRKGTLYAFLQQTFPEKCGDGQWQKNESRESESREEGTDALH